MMLATLLSESDFSLPASNKPTADFWSVKGAMVQRTKKKANNIESEKTS